MDSLDEALRRTAAQANAYNVPDKSVTVAASSLGRLPVPERKGIEVRALHEAVVLIAEAHRCAVGECDTCEAISNGLAVALAAIRAEIEEQFGQCM